MDFDWTEEQLMFKQAIRDFTEKEIAPLVDEAEEKEEFPVELFPKMGKLGYLAVGYPAEYDGGGMGSIGECILQEEVARVNCGIASALNAQIALGTHIIYDHGTEEQKQKYLIPALKGEKIAAFAMTEPDAGSDLRGIQTTAAKDGDSYVLNGSKIFTSNGPIADFICVLAYTDKEKGTRGGQSVFIVEKGTPGFKVLRTLKKLGIRSEGTGEEVFENCRVPAENLVGEEGRGFQYMFSSLNLTRIPAAARALGTAVAAYEAATDYAKDRQQFGQPVVKFQTINFKLVNVAMEIEAARWMVYHAAWLNDQGQECTKEAAMAKLFTSNVAQHVTAEAMHIFGGYGLMMESPVQRYFRDARYFGIVVGTDEINEMAIAWGIGVY